MKKFYIIIGVMSSLIIVLFSALLITNRPIKNENNEINSTMPTPKYYTIVEEGPLHEVVDLETRIEFDKSKKNSIEIDSKTSNSLLYNVGDIIDKGKKISTLSDYVTDREYYFDSYDISKDKLYVHLLPTDSYSVDIEIPQVNADMFTVGDKANIYYNRKNYYDISKDKLYVHLLPTDSYSVDIEIPQVNADMFTVGDKANIYYNRKNYTGTIVNLDKKISLNNTRKATLTVDTEDELIYNSSVTVTLKYAVKEHVTFVDNGVVMFDGFKHFVYLIDKENQSVREVTITIGEKTNAYTEVLSGLFKGDVIGRFYE